MEALAELIAYLRTSEVQLIQNFYSLKRTKNFEKRGLLFELLLQGKIKSNEKLMIRLYGRVNHAAFSLLKEKLKEEIVDLLITHESTVRRTFDNDHESFSTRKELLQLQWLRHRKMPCDTSSLFHRLSERIEQRQQLAEGLILKSIVGEHTNAYLNPELNTQSQTMILRSLEHLQDEARAALLWQKVAIPPHLRPRNEQFFLSMIKQVLQELQELRSQSSLLIQCRCSVMEAMIAHYEEDYEYSLSLIEDGAELLPHLPYWNLELYVAIDALRLSNHLRLGMVEEAETTFEQLVVALSDSLGEGLCWMEEAFFMALRANHPAMGVEIARVICEHDVFQQELKIAQRWNYLKAVALYCAGAVEQSLTLLMEYEFSGKVIPGISIHAGVVEIMCLFSNEDYELIEYRIEALVKKLRRRGASELNGDAERIQLMLQLLRKWIKLDFSFQLTCEKNKPLLQRLSTGNDIPWHPCGLEVLPFHGWLSGTLLPQHAGLVSKR